MDDDDKQEFIDRIKKMKPDELKDYYSQLGETEREVESKKILINEHCSNRCPDCETFMERHNGPFIDNTGPNKDTGLWQCPKCKHAELH